MAINQEIIALWYYEINIKTQRHNLGRLQDSLTVNIVLGKVHKLSTGSYSVKHQSIKMYGEGWW
jgi:hypothetical protein